jgi:RimJ/RimL family protein N-acetyltransferase
VYEGRLVRLRALEPGDAERAHPWMQDLDVTDGLTRRYPFSLAQQRRWMEQHAAPAYGTVQLAIETLEGVHIGGCGFFDASPENRSAEFGIAIGDKAYWGRGYGGDATGTACRFGFEEMNLHRIQLWVHADNPRAQRVYERLGFVVEGRAREAVYQHGRRVDLVLMSLVRED